MIFLKKIFGSSLLCVRKLYKFILSTSEPVWDILPLHHGTDPTNGNFLTFFFKKKFKKKIQQKKHTAPTIPVWSPTTVLGRPNPA